MAYAFAAPSRELYMPAAPTTLFGSEVTRSPWSAGAASASAAPHMVTTYDMAAGPKQVQFDPYEINGGYVVHGADEPRVFVARSPARWKRARRQVIKTLSLCCAWCLLLDSSQVLLVLAACDEARRAWHASSEVADATAVFVFCVLLCATPQHCDGHCR